MKISAGHTARHPGLEPGSRFFLLLVKGSGTPAFAGVTIEA